jgi:iron complex transport system substrate-binding protein
MKRRALLLLGVALAAAACSEGAAPSAQDAGAAPSAQRIVIAGGALAEIVYALGAGDRVVGADTSCVYPEAVQKLPQVGYQRKLSAEGVLSLRPTMLLASDEAGTPETLSQLEGAGVRVVRFDGVQTIDGAIARIRTMGSILGLTAEAEKLAEQTSRDVAAARAEIERLPDRPRALFVYARGPGTAVIGGKNTGAAAMIELAGGVNAAAEIEGFKAISAESVIAAKPDVIVIPERGLQSIGGADGLFALPGLGATPAGTNRRVAALDDLLLLGFGPRMAHALSTLSLGLRGSPPQGK